MRCLSMAVVIASDGQPLIAIGPPLCYRGHGVTACIAVMFVSGLWREALSGSVGYRRNHRRINGLAAMHRKLVFCSNGPDSSVRERSSDAMGGGQILESRWQSAGIQRSRRVLRRIR